MWMFKFKILQSIIAERQILGWECLFKLFQMGLILQCLALWKCLSFFFSFFFFLEMKSISTLLAFWFGIFQYVVPIACFFFFCFFPPIVLLMNLFKTSRSLAQINTLVQRCELVQKRNLVMLSDRWDVYVWVNRYFSFLRRLYWLPVKNRIAFKMAYVEFITNFTFQQ